MFWALVLLVLAVAAAALWLYNRLAAETAILRADHSRLIAAEADLRARLEAERANSAEKVRLLTEARDQIREHHSSSPSPQEALERNNRQFLELARSELSRHQSEAQGDLARRQQAIDEVVKPLKDSLARVDEKIHSIELARTGAYAPLTDQVKVMSEGQLNLREETRKLSSALKSPIALGRWGEIQLKRVVELAGMTAHCDFQEQVTVSTEDGRLRPDMIVRLPNGREVVVDSKVSLSAYLESLEAPTELAATEKLKQHAQQIRKHLDRLGQKSYSSQFEQAPDFVIAFLPGEIFFSAALAAAARPHRIRRPQQRGAGNPNHSSSPCCGPSPMDGVSANWPAMRRRSGPWAPSSMTAFASSPSTTGKSAQRSTRRLGLITRDAVRWNRACSPPHGSSKTWGSTASGS